MLKIGKFGDFCSFMPCLIALFEALGTIYRLRYDFFTADFFLLRTADINFIVSIQWIRVTQNSDWKFWTAYLDTCTNILIPV